MAPKSAAKSKRSRATAEQIRVMVDLIGETAGLASGRFQHMHGKLEHQKKWREVAAKLNAVGGATKSVEQWMTVWRDLKGRTSNRLRDHTNEQAQRGNRRISVAPLTETEMRIIDLIGENYVEGGGSSEDSASDEKQNLVIENKEEIEENEIQNKFLAIAEKQAETLRMLAENQIKLAENQEKQTEATLAMAKAIETLGEGLKVCAEAFNRLSSAIIIDGQFQLPLNHHP